MEEEDVEVDQENAETNSAGGNVGIQIYSFRIYIQCTCILQNPYLTEVHVCISAILWFCIKLQECRIMNTKL